MSRHNTTGNVSFNFSGTVTIHGWGGGGGQRFNTSAAFVGAGGAAYARKNNLSFSSGVTFGLTIGAGGTGNSTSGTNGGDTTVTYNAVTQIVAKGGVGSASGGAGGSAASSTGDNKFSGGSGGAGDTYFDGEFQQTFVYNGGSGGAGGETGNGGAGGPADANFGSGQDGSDGAGGTGYFRGGGGGGGIPGGGGHTGNGAGGEVELQVAGLPKIARRIQNFRTIDVTSWDIHTSPGVHFGGAAIASGEESFWVVIVGADGTPTLTETGGNGWTKEIQTNGTGCTLAVFTKKTTEAVAANAMPNFTLGSTASEQFGAQVFGYIPNSSQKTIKLLGTPTTATGSSTTPNPPASATNSTGAAKTCQVIAGRIADGANNATAAPSGYGRLYNLAGLSTGVSSAAAEMERSIANGGTDDPGTFTQASGAWVTTTVAIYEDDAVVTLSANTLAVGVPTYGNRNLTQTHNVGASALAVSAPVLATPAITQTHVLTASLTIGAPVLAAPTLTQNQVLSVANVIISAPVFTNPILTQTQILSASILTTGPPVLATPSLTQRYTVSVNTLAVSAPVLGTPVLTPIYVFSASLTVSAPVFGTVNIAQRHNLSSATLAVSAPVLANPTLTRSFMFTANNLTVTAPVLATPTVTQQHIVSSATLAVSAPVLGTPTITQAHILSATLTVGSPVFGTPALTQRHNLASATLAVSAPVLGSVSITQTHNLTANALTTNPPVIPATPAVILDTALQLVYPSSTASAGGWTTEVGGTDLHNSIDEAVADDNDYAKSPDNPTDAVMRVALVFAATAVVRDVKLRYRIGRLGSPAVSQTVRLYQGGGATPGAGTLIGGPWVHNVDGPQTIEQTINPASITTPNDLYLEVEAG